MSESAPLWILWSGSCLVFFIIGGGVGCLTQRWGDADELRTLRAQTHELSRDAKTCCDVAYVLNKYRQGAPAAELRNAQQKRKAR